MDRLGDEKEKEEVREMKIDGGIEVAGNRLL